MSFGTKLVRSAFAFIFALWAAGACARRTFADDKGGAELLERLDKLCSHVKGWGDQYTLSAWCGSPSRRGCGFCAFVRRLFRLLGEPTHTEDAARREGIAS